MKKGVSLIVLTIVVIVLLILASAITISVVNTQRKVKTLEFANEIANIQEKVNLYYKKYSVYPIDDESSEVIIEIEAKVEEQFEGENIQENKVTLNRINLSKIFESDSTYTDELDALRYGHNLTSDDVYLISTKTGNVYYKASVYDNYTLTEDLKKKINYVEELQGSLSVSNIIFEKSENEYTNNPIVTTVKVPQDYIVTSCKVVKENLNTIFLDSSRAENGYNIYTTSNDIESNYTIVLSWKETQTSKENITSFVVDNFDNTAPEIQIIGDKHQVINNITSEEQNFYFIEYYDDKSGVQEVKYAEHNIISDNATNYNENLEVIRKYMQNNGKRVESNSVNVLSGTRFLTLYIKDYVGNDKYLIRELSETEKVGNQNL